MIDLIIPAYNTHTTIINTLISISLQTISDKFKVYVIDDCSDEDYSKEIDIFKDKINIIQLKLNENSGPGVARQYGIEHSDNDFIMFMDSDDVFYDCFSAEKIFNMICKCDCDLAMGHVIEETLEQLYEYEYTTGDLHGKIYRRSFLEKYNIKFNSTSSSEDNGFHKLFLMASPRIIYCENIIYLYRYNYNSITRKDSDYMFKMIEFFSYNMVWAVEEAIKRNFDNKKIATVIFSSLIYLYKRFICIDDLYKSQLLSWCRQLYVLYVQFENILDFKEKNEVYLDYNLGFMVPVSFNEFVKMIKEYNGI